MDVVFFFWYIGLLGISYFGSIVNRLGESISKVGQWLMKFDPLRF